MSDDTTRDDEQDSSDAQEQPELSAHELETVAGGWSSTVGSARCGCGALEGACSCNSTAPRSW